MARTPEFRKPEGVHVKQPDPVDLFGEDKIETVSDWGNLPANPYVGQVLVVTPDGEREDVVTWKITRSFNKETSRFEPRQFWAHRATGVDIGYEPLGARVYVEPIFVPKKRAP